MSRRTIRLGSTLSFDEEKEKDIIDAIETLSRSHKLGELVSHIIRVAFDNPGDLESREKLNKAFEEVSRLGMSRNRFEFFQQVSRTIEEMKAKVDTMYDMNLKLLTLAQFGKRLGIEERTDSMLAAQFVLQKQIDVIANTLGITHPNHTYYSNKIQETHEKADDILVYILESYDNIINELKESLVGGVNTVTDVSEESNKTDREMEDRSVDIQEDEEDNPPEVSGTTSEEPEEKEEYIDFGDADLGALASFFGE
mgnify:CR=1 FL=1